MSSYSQYYKEEMQFNKYNSFGNVLQWSCLGEKTTYLWSYNHQHIVAEIKNASYGEVEAALTKTYLENLSRNKNPDISTLDTNLRNAFANKMVMIITYTHKPLVGITSQTDERGFTTYFAYDILNRLKETYFMENGAKRVMQDYDYHYKNQ